MSMHKKVNTAAESMTSALSKKLETSVLALMIMAIIAFAMYCFMTM